MLKTTKLSLVPLELTFYSSRSIVSSTPKPVVAPTDWPITSINHMTGNTPLKTSIFLSIFPPKTYFPVTLAHLSRKCPTHLKPQILHPFRP